MRDNNSATEQEVEKSNIPTIGKSKLIMMSWLKELEWEHTCTQNRDEDEQVNRDGSEFKHDENTPDTDLREFSLKE